MSIIPLHVHPLISADLCSIEPRESSHDAANTFLVDHDAELCRLKQCNAHRQVEETDIIPIKSNLQDITQCDYSDLKSKQAVWVGIYSSFGIMIIYLFSFVFRGNELV